MEIYLTDEQWKQFSTEGQERDGVRCAWINLKHESSGMEVYLEALIEGGRTTVNYVEVSGKDGFYGDKETVDKFLEFGKRPKLNDKNNECPSCFTPMIYHFNYCPKCGQILRWEENNG